MVSCNNRKLCLSFLIVTTMLLIMLASFSLIFLKQSLLAEKNGNAITMTQVTTRANTISPTSQNSTNLTTNVNNGFQTYENPIYGIRILYPSNWTPSQTGLRDHTNIIAF